MYIPPISAIIAIDPMAMVYGFHSPRTSDVKTLQKVIRGNLASDISIRQTIPLPNHLHRISILRLSNEKSVVLKLTPSTNTPILRHERHHLASEAAILTLLSKSHLPIPQILRYNPASYLVGSPFLLTAHLPGIPYSDTHPDLTNPERGDVEQQLHAFSSYISKFTTSTFGPAALVANGSGLSTWRDAFTELMENLLKDGEDMTVNLPYTAIRKTVTKRGHFLNKVKEARLVVTELESRENVRIERKTNDVVGLTGFGGALCGDPAFGDVRRDVASEDGG